MKSRYLIYLFLIFSFPIFSQINPDSTATEEVEEVLICIGKDYQAFHSDKRCTGLDNVMAV